MISKLFVKVIKRITWYVIPSDPSFLLFHAEFFYERRKKCFVGFGGHELKTTVDILTIYSKCV